MAEKNLTLINAALQKMQWHSARQGVIAKNISNVDTVGYKSKDIKPLDFKSLLQGSSSGMSLSTATTDSKHLTLGSSSNTATGNNKSKYAIKESGMSVVLEDQLLKMNQNHIDHRLTTAIYQKNIDMIKKAINAK